MLRLARTFTSSIASASQLPTAWRERSLSAAMTWRWAMSSFLKLLPMLLFLTQYPRSQGQDCTGRVTGEDAFMMGGFNSWGVAMDGPRPGEHGSTPRKLRVS